MRICAIEGSCAAFESFLLAGQLAWPIGDAQFLTGGAVTVSSLLVNKLAAK